MPSEPQMRCGGCRHRGLQHEQQPNYRQCLRIARLIAPEASVVMGNDDPAFTHDASGNFSAIYTNDNFGCVLFEAKN